MCESPITILRDKELVTVPCGKCILCRRKKCRQWALKLYHESQYYSKMCMVTLTFKPKFLFRPKWKTLYKIKTRKKDGKIIRKKVYYETCISPKYITDVRLTGWLVTLFLKKLRKELAKYGTMISFFAVGEHGSQNTHRAHWHILFFGIDKNSLGALSIGQSKKKKEIYYSPIIEKLWSYENMNIGMHTISDVTQNTIKYVANYTMKKIYKNINKDTQKYPTIMRFSNQNKIGLKWARRFHQELRKPYLQDCEGMRYTVPRAYLNEMKRYEGSLENETMNITAEIIEQNKLEMIERMRKAGLLTKEQIQKKAQRLKERYKKEDRDTF